MLFRKNGMWQLCDKRLTYEDGEDTHTILTGDISWWEMFAATWGHVKILSVEEVWYSEEQHKRYEHIKYMPEDFEQIYSHYVEFGEIHEDAVNLRPEHPFNIIVLKHKELADNSAYLLNVDFRLLMVELGLL